jgi:hypothetical protein
MTYLWKCTECDFTGESSRSYEGPPHKHALRRDYKAESSNVWTFTNALGEGKVQARAVKPEDNVPRTGPMIGGAS